MERIPITRQVEFSKLIDGFILSSGRNAKIIATTVCLVLGVGFLAISLVQTVKLFAEAKEWAIYIYFFSWFPILLLGFSFVYKAIQYFNSIPQK